MSIKEIALKVKDMVQKKFPEKDEIRIETFKSEDGRSYHINSDKIKEKSNERDELKIEKQENNFNNQVISDHSIKKDSIVKNETFTGYSHLNCLFNENNKTTNNYI